MGKWEWRMMNEKVSNWLVTESRWLVWHFLFDSKDSESNCTQMYTSPSSWPLFAFRMDYRVCNAATVCPKHFQMKCLHNWLDRLHLCPVGKEPMNEIAPFKQKGCIQTCRVGMVGLPIVPKSNTWLSLTTSTLRAALFRRMHKIPIVALTISLADCPLLSPQRRLVSPAIPSSAINNSDWSFSKNRFARTQT